MNTRVEPFGYGLPVMILAGIVAIGLCGPSMALADDSSDLSGSKLFRKGSKQIALTAGYGEAFRPGSSGHELNDVGIVNVIPRVGFGVTDPIGESWYHGNLEVLLEGAFLIGTRNASGFAAGGGLSFRYNFLHWDTVVPFADANLGIIGMDFDLDRQRDGFNFNVGAGLGSHWFVSDRAAITTEIRYQHISNARTKLPNNGINDVLFLLGVSYFFD